jgi:hypothetical protein
VPSFKSELGERFERYAIATEADQAQEPKDGVQKEILSARPA